MKFERISPEAGTPVDLKFEDPELAEKFEAEAEQPESEENSETAEEQSEALEYQAERERWAETKAEYKDAKAAYEDRLAEYYDSYSEKGVAGRTTQKLGEWWNGKPDDLEQLEAEFKSARASYAQGLESVLGLRSKAHEGNQEFEAGHIDTRKAFAKRFILDPRREQLNIEKEHLHSTETAEQAKKLMHILQRNKWGVRIGTVAATGIIVGSGAGVLAGAAAGGVRAARIAGGMVGGYYGAKIGDAWGKEGVAQAESGLRETQRDTVTEFTVQDIDRLESALVDAENTVDTKQRQRKYKMIAGAIVGGGSLANLDSIGDAVASPAHAEAFVPEAEPSLDEALREQLLTPPNTMMDDPFLREMFENNIDAARVAHEAAEAAEAEAIAAEAMRVLRETTPVEDYTVEGGDNLWNITKESYEHILGDLPEAEQNRILDAVFDKLRTDSDLVSELGIGSGNIDLIHPDEVLEMNALQDLIREELHRATAEVEVPEGAVTVSPDDNLWNLTKNAYTEQLNGLSEAQQNQVLDGVFDAVRRDPALIEQLGVTSGNIDLIRPGEVMNLPLLSELLAAEVERVTAAGEPDAIVTATETERVVDAGAGERIVTEPGARVAAAEAAEYPTGSLQERALAIFGTQEAFTDAKLRLIERITGHEPGYLSVDGHQERVFSRIMTVELDSLQELGLDRATHLEESLARPFLLRVGLSPANEYNFPTLEKWFQFYRANIQPERLAELGIERQPGMTLNDLVNEYLLATSR